MCVLIELLEEEFFEKIVNTNVDGNNVGFSLQKHSPLWTGERAVIKS